MRAVAHKARSMSQANRVMKASDEVVRTLGRRVRTAEDGANALALALARVCVASDVDLEEQLQLARFVADTMEAEAC
jgi:hypothetical protein